MKKIIYLITLVFMFTGIQAFAAPHGGHGNAPIHGGVSARHHGPTFHVSVGRPLPMYRHYRPMIRPYYPTVYYSPYTTYSSYTYYTYEPVATELPVTQTVVVRDNYAGINTAANVINAAANVAATVKYLSW